MKKLYYILTLTFITLLAACSQEEMVNKKTEDNRVCISAELPADIAATRAQIAVPADYKLRCIIEVWTKSVSPTLKYRQEVAVDGGELPTFDFGLRPGDYNCLMWTDFIKKDAATSEVTSEDVTYTHFEDTFYDTSDLHAVSIKEGATDHLFDTDLCDGFYATLDIKKNATAVQQTMKMKRPFAKLIVKENATDKFASLNGMTVECQLPKTFSVATGEPTTEMVTAMYDKIFQPGDNTQVLFTSYVFVPSSGLSMGSFILSFDTKAGKSRCEIPAESVNLKRNQQLVAAGKLMEGGTVEPEPEPEPSEDPQIGDYFFIDGTWSSELTDENKDDCVGIVYAVGAQSGDEIGNYPNSDGKTIKGYVVSLKPLTPTEEFVQDVHKLSDRLYLYNKNNKIALPKPELKNDIINHNGYAMTQKLLSFDLFKAHIDDEVYPALQCFYVWLNEVANKTIPNASEWYIPSARQVLDIIGGSYGFAALVNPAVDAMEKNALGTSLAKVIDAKIGSPIGGNGYNVYNSSLNQNEVPEPITIQVNKEADKEMKGGLNTIKYNRANVAGYVRPVLTIIK